MKSKKSLMIPIGVSAAMMLMGAAAHAQIYTANLNGAHENPPSGSSGTAFATITLDLALHTLEVDLTFSGLGSNVQAAHIHAPTSSPFDNTVNAGIAVGLTGFPTGVTSGSYSHIFMTLDSSIYSSGYLSANGGTASGAEQGLASDLAAGKAYLNIHTTNFPGGEIRGFLVPEPATVTFIAIGAMGLLLGARKARRS